MALFELTRDSIRRLEPTSYAHERLRERADLQRLLRDQIAVIAGNDTGEPDLLVVAEEFAEWTDSRRRIDLLALDRSANLVVIEPKRDDHGGHMELQAIRYAAMVSTMTFEQVVDVFRRFQAKHGRQEDAQTAGHATGDSTARSRNVPCAD